MPTPMPNPITNTEWLIRRIDLFMRNKETGPLVDQWCGEFNEALGLNPVHTYDTTYEFGWSYYLFWLVLNKPAEAIKCANYFVEDDRVVIRKGTTWMIGRQGTVTKWHHDNWYTVLVDGPEKAEGLFDASREEITHVQ